jgi:hypothetical protein
VGVWGRSVTAVFDLESEPHKVHILGQACRVADIIAELDESADAAPLTVKVSMGQPVISRFISEARAQRATAAVKAAGRRPTICSNARFA